MPSNEPFPTAPITWQGRDAKGNLVDVTSDTTVTSMPPSVSSGGGEQTVRLLGPYTVTDTTPDVATGHLFSGLTAGMVVMRVWGYLRIPWGDHPNVTLGISLVSGEDSFGYYVGDVGASNDYDETEPWAIAITESSLAGPALMQADGGLSVYVIADGGTTAEGGVIDVYALIAESAA